MAIDIVYDRPVVNPAGEIPWLADASRDAYSPTEKSLDIKIADAGTQGTLEELGFPKIPTMTAETQAAGQLDDLLRNWNGQSITNSQCQQIMASIQGGLYGIKRTADVRTQLTDIQDTLNRYLEGSETPFRDSTSSTPLVVELQLNSNGLIHMQIRNSETEKIKDVWVPPFKVRESKYPPF